MVVIAVAAGFHCTPQSLRITTCVDVVIKTICARGIAIDNHRRFFFVGVAVNSSLEEGDNSYVAFDDETSGKGELYMVEWGLEVELFDPVARKKRKKIYYAKYFEVGRCKAWILVIWRDRNFPWSASPIAMDTPCSAYSL